MERKLILDFDRKQKQQKKAKHHHGHGRRETAKHDKKPKLDRESPPPSSSSTANMYRDRAKERREGINRDFDLDPDDLIISNPIVDGGQQVDEAERRRQLMEESKYLGGDVEHTHLVKGLDFALYEKIKKQAESEDAKTKASNRLQGNRDLILADRKSVV